MDSQIQSKSENVYMHVSCVCRDTDDEASIGLLVWWKLAEGFEKGLQEDFYALQ